MNNDIFVEQMVERKQTGKNLLIKIGIIIAAILVDIIFFFVPILNFFFLFALVLSGLLAIRFIRGQSVEYEYAFTNGDLDIDKIMGKKMRKRVLNIDCKNFEIMAKMTEEYKAEYSSGVITKTIDASSSTASENRWFARFIDSDGANTLLIFEPNEKVLNAMWRYIPGKLKGWRS